ncbi:MAG: hypothetical protein AABX48_02670 [Nanoarchaeota archaeon]
MRIINGKKGEGEGILPGETVKIIIAVIGILALFYLAVSLYGIFNNKTEIEQAKASLDEIIREANNLQDGGSKDVLITAPSEWKIIYYKKDISNLELVSTPSTKCSGKSCLCVCPTEHKGDAFPDWANCNSGVCQVLNYEVNPTLELTTGIKINILDLFVSKKNGIVTIESSKGSLSGNNNYLDQILSTSVSGKSLQDILYSYIPNKDGGLHDALTKALDSFSSTNSINIIFYVSDLSTGQRADVFSYGDFNSGAFSGTPITKKINVGGKDYEIFFNSKTK